MFFGIQEGFDGILVVDTNNNTTALLFGVDIAVILPCMGFGTATPLQRYRQIRPTSPSFHQGWHT
jgi:hypothetical protein